jgi:hypothetical protein
MLLRYRPRFTSQRNFRPYLRRQIAEVRSPHENHVALEVEPTECPDSEERQRKH